MTTIEIIEAIHETVDAVKQVGTNYIAIRVSDITIDAMVQLKEEGFNFEIMKNQAVGVGKLTEIIDLYRISW